VVLDLPGAEACALAELAALRVSSGAASTTRCRFHSPRASLIPGTGTVAAWIYCRCSRLLKKRRGATRAIELAPDAPQYF